MWFCPKKYERETVNINDELMKLEGELTDPQVKETLAKFLRHNIGYFLEIVSGVKLAHYQEITIKAFFNRDFNMCVWGRGCAKSFVAAMFCILQCVLEPGSKILIAGPTFRTARNIFNEIEKFINNPAAALLFQAFNVTPPSHKNDLLYWRLSNGSTITAIPLNGDKIRGFRANFLIIDEYLLLSEDMIKNVLMPFLFSPKNVAERMKIREIEDELIKEKVMEEHERTVFANS